ncbi:MAG: hypothetical protein OYG32_16360 [Rhodospirillaceae bacterium]|nr:hypothetical protein [Rhodospirillaceae bacterium]
MIGAAVGMSGGGCPAAVFPHRHEGDGIMTAAMAMPGNTAATFLVHFFGTGLADDRYVVERFKARADGDIVPAPAEALAAKGARKTKRTTATLKAVKELRPATTEIIICTGLKTRGGIQVWGSIAAGILCDRKQKG